MNKADPDPTPPQSSLILYQTDDGQTRVAATIKDSLKVRIERSKRKTAMGFPDDWQQRPLWHERLFAA